MNEFISKHGVRIFAVIAAVTPILVTRFPGIPWEALAGLAAALLGVGEAAQRHEDSKTAAALEAQSPWDRAALAQAALVELEKAQAAPVAEPAAEVPAIRQPIEVAPQN